MAAREVLQERVYCDLRMSEVVIYTPPFHADPLSMSEPLKKDL